MGASCLLIAITAISLLLAASTAAAPSPQIPTEFPACPTVDGEGRCSVRMGQLRPIRFTRPLIESLSLVGMLENPIYKSQVKIQSRTVFVVIGFDGSIFALNQYGLLSALAMIGATEEVINAVVVKDMRGMNEMEFWVHAEEKEGWLWRYDAKGAGPIDVAFFPRTFDDLTPDPFLDLVRELGYLGLINIKDAQDKGVFNARERWAESLRKVVPSLETFPAPALVKWCRSRPYGPSCIGRDKSWSDWIKQAKERAPEIVASPFFRSLPGYINR